MSAKKVIIIGPAHPYRGGIANFNNSLADAFFKNGDDIEILSFKLQYPSFLFPSNRINFIEKKKNTHFVLYI